jgi:hypothetical protein
MVIIMVAWLVASFRREQGKKKQPQPVARGSLTTDSAPSDVRERVDERVDDVAGQQSPVLAEAPPEPEVALPASRPPAPAVQTRPPGPGDVLLMQVLRDREGFLVVEVEGQRYRRLFDIRDGEVGQRVWDIINRLLAFSKGRESQVPLPPTPQVSPPQVSPPQVLQAPAPVPTSATGGVDPDGSQEFFEQFQQADVPAPVRKQRITADPVPFRSRDSSLDAHISLNLAEEIDQVLQMHVRASPAFDQRFIHVRSAPDGALRFQVDEGHYSSIDEIPDPQVQALIRSAIAEWESRR